MRRSVAALGLGAAVWVAAALPAPVLAAFDAYAVYRRIAQHIDAWHPERALELLDEMAESAPDEPLRHLAAARVKFELGDYAGAVAALDALTAAAGELPAYAATAALIRTTYERTRGFVTQRSQHFAASAAPGSDEMLLPFVLETAEAALAAVRADLGWSPPAEALPIRIEIFPTVRDFVAVSTLTAEEVATSGTVALCKFNRLMIVSPRRMARGYRWRDTLGHELIHFVLSRMTENRLPLWLHEGTAKFLERRWHEPVTTALHPIQQSLLAEARARKVYVPFAQMMPSLAKLDTGWKTALAFSEVTLLVQQLVGDGGFARLREVIAGFAESEAAGFRALGVVDEEELWAAFVARLETVPLEPVPGYSFIPPSLAEDPDRAEPEPVESPDAQKWMRLGDLLRRQGHWAAAVSEYTKAEVALGHKPAPLGLRLAEAYMLGGRYLDAAAELKELLRRDPDRATAHWLSGKIDLFRGDAAAAMAAYERAFAIAPFHDEVLDGLIAAAEKLGDTTKLERYTQAKEIWHARRDASPQP